MRCLLLLLTARSIAAAALTYCWDVPSISPPSSLPLCGNGRLDPGEVCDDGNQIGGDGCNAFCSFFDAMAATGTLAGSTTPCSRGRPIVGNTLSTTFFCDLRALEPTPEGDGVLLADGGTLLRFDLFTDATTGTIVPVAASIDQTMVRICSMAYMHSDGALLIHDCGSGQFFAADTNGNRVQMVSDLSAALSLTDTRAHYNRTARTAIVAGSLRDETEGCVGVYGLTLSSLVDWTFSATRTDIAKLPCTVYGVYEEGMEGKRWTSMDMRGMVPYLVGHDRCPPTLRLDQWCYVIYMQSVAHLDLMRAYLPEEGGLDIQYYVKTLNRFDNALGAPMVRPSLVDPRRIYTLRGACLSMEQRLVTADGKTPPIVTLGNTCKRTPQLGLDCTTPFNNAFINDVMSSPSLLPLGLSANHTHAELTAIFNATCEALSNVTSVGPLFYQSVLNSVYGNTTPVDLVELPRTLDVLYITPTAVGLISTKRILFADRSQTGYVRATDLIYCPEGRFGSVASGICHACTNASAPGYYISIAWQIQCSHTAYETFTLVTGPDTTTDLLHAQACVYTESRNVTCPLRIDLTPQQVFNLDGDLYVAPAATSNAVALLPCLIEAASNTLGVPLFRINRPEFMTRAVSPGRALLTASSTKRVGGANYSDRALASQSLSMCDNTLAKSLGSFLACSTPLLGAKRRRMLRRRLLQTPDTLPVVTAHHDLALGSTAFVSYARVLPSADGAAPSTNANANKQGPNLNQTASSDAFPVALAVGVAVGGVVVVGLLVALFLSFSGSHALAARRRSTTEARFAVSSTWRGRVAGKRVS